MYLKHGAYYFANPATSSWEPLGKDLGAALAAYAMRIGGVWSGRTLGDVIDRYRAEVLPLKRAATTRTFETRQLGLLRGVFGDMLPDSVTAQHCYRYMDGRRGKTGKPVPSAARHEIKLLGHVFTKAIRWGVATINPVRTLEHDVKARMKRYVTNEEFAAVWDRSTERMRVAMDLALLTGLRRGDLLALTRACLTDDGIAVQTSKTGAGLLILWTTALREAVERAKRLKPQVPGTYLLRTREGHPYSAAGFAANWKRTMAKAVAQAEIEPFTFHDLRRKSASDSESVTEAQARLGHSSEAVTRQFYMAKPARVRPLR